MRFGSIGKRTNNLEKTRVTNQRFHSLIHSFMTRTASNASTATTTTSGAAAWDGWTTTTTRRVGVRAGCGRGRRGGESAGAERRVEETSRRRRTSERVVVDGVVKAMRGAVERIEGMKGVIEREVEGLRRRRGAGKRTGRASGRRTAKKKKKTFLASAASGSVGAGVARWRPPRMPSLETIRSRDKRKLSRQEAAARRLTSGTLAAVVVRTVLAPLERVKIEYLLNGSALKPEALVNVIMQKEGLGGFWKGNMLNIARTAPFKAINFCAFDTYREFVYRSFPEGSDARKIGLLCAGAGAGMTAVITCFPMDVIRTRLLTAGGIERYGSFLACVRRMYREEGLSTFYRGITPALVSMAPNAAVYYSIYDGLKNRRLAQLNEERAAEIGRNGKRSKSKEADGARAVKTIEQKNMMLYGAIAGVASEACTYPFEVVRRRMQMQGGRSSTAIVFGRKALMAMASTLRSVSKDAGIRGLYAGLGPSCIQVLPSAALGYYTYEMFKLMLSVD